MYYVFQGHTIPKLCMWVNAIFGNLRKITEPSKRQFKVENILKL